MLRVSLVSARPGMVLAQGIYNASGQVLLREGEALTAEHIRDLEQFQRIHRNTSPLTVLG